MGSGDWIKNTMKYGSFEQAVALNKVPGYFSGFFLGVNPVVDTALEEDLVRWGQYTFQDASTPVPFYLSSTNAGDVGLVYVALLLDGDYKEHTVVMQTNGQSGVPIVAPDGTNTFIRGQILFNVTPTGTASLGDVFVGTEAAPTGGEPANANKVLGAYATEQQSSQAVHTTPVNEEGLIEALVITTNRNTTGGSSDIYLNTRTENQPARRRAETGVQVSGSSILDYNFRYPVRIPPKTDIWLSAEVTNNNTSLAGGFQLLRIDTTIAP